MAYLRRKEEMMKSLGSQAMSLVVSFVCIIITVHLQISYASSAEYIRHPARGIISTPHERSDSDPQQVHISLAGEDHMRISWITDDETVRSVVEYGRRPGRYEASSTGEHTSYEYFSYSSGKIHHVKIGPLNSNTKYYYRCGGFGPEFSFRTPPTTLPIEFAIAGDLGQTDWTLSTLDHIYQSDYDVFLLPGDLSYANGQQPLWDSFGRLVEPLASQRPWMVTEGNHEVESSTSPDNSPHPFIAYNSRWLMPFEESTSSSNLYYSFDVAGTHVIMLGSYVHFTEGSHQYKWLESDLARVDRKRTPWLIVLLHAPWYNTNTAHQGEGEKMRKAMEEMLYNAQVDIVFAGHVHAYERFNRVYDNEADPCGPIFVTIGDGGNREGLAMTYTKLKEPILSKHREASFGHGRLRLVNDTHAYWSWHRNNDSNSIVGDEIWFESLSASEACNVEVQAQASSYNDEL